VPGKRGAKLSLENFLADTRQWPDKNYAQNITAQELMEALAHQAQLALIQQQNQQKIIQTNDEALKEEVWLRDYKKFTVCPADEHMVECGNRYIKTRAKFEQYGATNSKSLACENQLT
jgi:endonuclease/exonuclease/phosphatase (EEP) superfamily protein YafD